MSSDDENTSTRLTTAEFWESRYAEPAGGKPARPASRLKRFIRRRLGQERLARYGDGYTEYHFWNVLLRKYLTPETGAKVLEVGCAPGGNLVQLHKIFGYIPFGVEYTQAGVDLTRRTLQEHQLDTANVIHSDFFSESFQKQYAGCFNAVISRGFIEHFESPGPVLEKHLSLLSPGGTLIVTIPNFRGLNYWLGWIFIRDALPMHNLGIMALTPFRQLMSQPDLVTLFCGYQGVFSLRFFDSSCTVGWRRIALPVMRKIDYLLGILLYAIFGGAPRENRFTSPQLVFIGMKRQSSAG